MTFFIAQGHAQLHSNPWRSPARPAEQRQLDLIYFGINKGQTTKIKAIS